MCTKQDNPAFIHMCDSYVAGFGQGMIAAQAMARHGSPVCLPETLTSEQAQTIILKFMAERPTLMNQEAMTLAAVALSNAFPCKNSN